ncbi:hypothetical protein SAMN05444743_10679 [Pseudomonas sp. PDC86]|jgi:hypothetical protein|uniref:Uncharacterized protein n=2 Tax=Pseudomonas TaxID=286 RepID=A0A5M9J167_9PSED|nr:hypothetical protein U771_11450 [Pseudomonas sp. TKP]KAA8561922.1 hypothetical protein FX985_01988 [Pseudomonas extremaustralis]MDR6579128.1 hypothetical protein [Pseudomonas extremaustralis]SDY85232.1 hypothetical protein SAMN05444743_10679 [Pseudomonas sp. PDC86]
MPRMYLFRQPLWLDLIAGLSAFGMAFCATQSAEVRDER